MNVFIREAPTEKNIASERIRTVAATYGCKNFTGKFYNHVNTMRNANDAPKIPVHAA